MKRIATGISRRTGSGRGFAVAVCLGPLTACATPSTTVDRVWRSGDRMAAPLGKTLVLALTPDAEVAIPLKNEWVRQLRDRGVEANAVNALLPGNHLPDEKSVVELVRAGGYTTLLV